MQTYTSSDGREYGGEARRKPVTREGPPLYYAEDSAMRYSASRLALSTYVRTYVRARARDRRARLALALAPLANWFMVHAHGTWYWYCMHVHARACARPYARTAGHESPDIRGVRSRVSALVARVL